MSDETEDELGTAHGITEDQLADALTKSRGMVTAAAKMVGRTPRAVYKRIKKSPRLTELVATERELQLDITELQLFKAIDKGQAWAICFYLKCVGKARGYVEQPQRLEVQGHMDHVHIDGSKVFREVLDQLDNDPRWTNYARDAERANLAGLPEHPGHANEQGQSGSVSLEAGEASDVRRGSDSGRAPETRDGDPTF